MSVFTSCDIPERGLILVFGGIATGKDAGVIDPLITQLQNDGREVLLVDDFSSGAKPPLVSEKDLPAVLILRNASSLFGPAKEWLSDLDTDLREMLLNALCHRFPALVVLSFQGVGSISELWREMLLKKSTIQVILGSVDVATNELVAGRTYRKLRFFEAEVPRPANFVKSWRSRAIVSTRRNSRAPWHNHVRRLRFPQHR